MIEQEQNIEELDIPIDDNEGQLETPLSLRDEIAKAKDGVQEKSERERDESGKFTKKSDKAEKLETAEKQPKSGHELDKQNQKAPIIADKPQTPEKPEQIPQGLSAAVKAKWKELPPEVRNDFIKREADFHKELTKHDEERNFGRQIDKIIAPYMPQIRLEGATAPQAIENLLNMAHLLRVGTPQQKSELLLRTAQTFGVDLRQAMQQVRQPENPVLQQAMQKIQQLESRLTQQDALKKQQEDESIQGLIQTFAADPKNVHFEAVKAHMASLLKSGLAKDLQDAYDQAVYANPNTRSTLLQQQQQMPVDQKRVAEQKARAMQARKAGSSIKGAPGVVANKNGKIVQPNLRSELRAAFASHNEG